MSESARDRWLSYGMSVLLHGGLIALLAVGLWHFHHSAPAPSLPINATVIDARTLKGLGTASTHVPKHKPAPQTQPPPLEGPPPPTPDEVAMREQAAKEEAQHQAEAQQELLARQQAEQEEQEKEQAAAAEQAAQAKATAEAKQAAEAAQAKKRKLAEARKKAEAKQLAARKLAQQRKLAREKKLAEEQAAQERAARVADLQRSLQEDQQAAAASGQLASWQAEITSRIQQAWIRPPTAQPGIKCVLNVTQVPGGSVTDVSIGECNGDEAVRESIQAAVYRASPLPPPPDPSLFQRELIITFQPTN